MHASPPTPPPALPMPTYGEQAEATKGEVEPSETGRKWVALPPATLTPSYRQTRDQRPNPPILPGALRLAPLTEETFHELYCVAHADGL